MVIDSDIVFLRKFGEHLHVIHVGAAYADVEEYRNAVLPHILDEIFEVRPDWSQRLRQTRFLINTIHRQIHRAQARITKAIDYIGLHQPAIGGQVHNEIFLGCVIDDFMNEFRPQQRLSAHQCQEPVSECVQPIYGAPGHGLCHALHAVVVGPAVMAIEVTFPFTKKVGN